MENLYLIFFVIIYFSSTQTIGRLVLKFIGAKFEEKIEKNIFAFGLGNIFYACLFVFLGMFHILFKEILLFFYLLPFIVSLFFFFVGKSYLKLNLKARFASLMAMDGFDIFVWILLLFTFFPIIPNLFLYPASWDPLAYHLTLPKLYLSLHNFPFYEHFPQMSFPIGIESLYGFGEVFRDPRIGNFINFGLLGLAAYYMIFGLRYAFDKKVLLLATYVYLWRHLFFTELAITPFVDYGFAFFSLLCGISIYKFLKNKSLEWFTLILVFATFLSLIKTSGIFISIAAAGVSVLFIIFEYFKNKKLVFKLDSRKAFKLGVIILFILIPVLFWYLRTWNLTGNPVYPFFNGFFKGVDYDPNSRSQLREIRESNLFYAITKFNLLHGKDTAQDYNFATDVMSFVMLTVFAFISLLSRDVYIRWLSLFALIAAIPIALITGPLTRYYLPMIPILAIIASNKFFSLLTAKKYILFNLGFIGFFLLIFFMQIDTGFDQREYFYTQKPKLSLLAMFVYKQDVKNLYEQDNYKMIDYINKNLDKNKDRVLVVFDNRLYYLDIPSAFDNPSINGYFTNPKTKDENEVYKSMKSNGFTHVLITTNWGTYKNLRYDIYKPFVDKYLVKLHTEKGINEPIGLTFYKLK